MRPEEEDGAAAVEFALLVPIFAAVLFGIIQFGWYFWNAEMTNSAARETARRVIVGDCWNNGAATSFARSQAPQMTGNVQWSPAPSTAMSPGDTITVTVTSDSGLINFIPGIPDTVTRQYTARMEFAVNSGTCP